MFLQIFSFRTSLVSLVAVSLVAGLFTVAPVSSVAAQTDTDATSSQQRDTTAPLQRPDLVSAAITARTAGERVEVLSERGEATTTWANPDGTLTTERHAGPVRVFDPEDKRDGENGSWRPIDTDLVDDGRRLRPAVANADMAFSDGGGGLAAQLAVGERSLGFGWPGDLPEPVVDGAVVTYADVSPGTDLEFEALTSGFAQRIVLHQRPAASENTSFTIPLALDGLAISADEEGLLELTRPDGRLLAASAPSMMWDARTTDLDGDDPSHFAPVGSRLIDTAAGKALEITPDAAFLADPDTVFPVVIDPSPYITWTDTHVRSDRPDTNYHTDEHVRVGARNSGVSRHRPLLKFSLGDLDGKDIVSAKLNLYEISSGSCTPRKFEVRRVSESYGGASVTWSNQPSIGSTVWSTVNVAKGHSADCPNGWVGADVTGLVQSFADGATNYGIQIRAYDETLDDAFKSFHSEQNTNKPYITVTYNSPPANMTAAVPSSGTFVNTSQPKLSGGYSDPDLNKGKVIFEIAKNDASSTHVYTRSTSSSDFVASGSTSTWTVPSAAGLVDGTQYKWRGRNYDGRLYSSNTSWRTFTVDTTKPTVPTISSSSHPDENQWYDATTLDASWTASSDANLAGYNVAFSQSAITTPTVLQTTRTASKTVSANSGLWYLHVQAKDKAGNLSPTVSRYKFYVGDSAISEPAEGDRTQRRINLEAQGPATLTDVTFEWRQPNGTWATVPADAVTRAATNEPIGTWPVAKGSASSPLLVWDVPATLGDYSGPLEVRARFNATTSASSVTEASGDFTLDQHALGGDYGHADIAPGLVNLLTGNFSLSATDVDVAAGPTAVSITRTFNSRNPAASADGPFGPGWTLAASNGATGADYTNLRVTTTTGGLHSFVTVVAADGSELHFIAVPKGSGYDYSSDEGLEHLTLKEMAGTFELIDMSGTTVTFAPSGGSYVPSSVSVVGGDQTTYLYEAAGARRLLRIMGPPPTGITDCTGQLVSLPRGCRVLTLEYGDVALADATTVSRLSVVNFTAWDADQDAPVTEAVARYDYDASGRLLAACDPRIEQVNPGGPLKTSYTYDTDGRIATVTPPGELPWTPHYSSGGRLSKVTRPALPTGTATTSIAYGVALSGAGAPYQMDAAAVAQWGQTDLPTDAAAIFGPTVVPADPPTSTDYPKASIIYLNSAGRIVNEAAPGGGITTSEHDQHGDVTREVTAGNRARILAAEDPSVLKNLLDTHRTYDASGLRLLDETGPQHTVTLPDGSMTDGRRRATYTYDEGAPTEGAPFHLPTTMTVGVAIDGGATAADVRVTTIDYDWTLRLPTKTTVDPGGLNLVHTTLYNADGQEIERRQPSEPDGGGPGTLLTRYYAAGAHSDADCAGRPEWANLECKTFPAAQPTGADRPGLPVIRTSYDRWLQPAITTETVSRADGTTATRSWVTEYDGAGRVRYQTVTGGDATALPAMRIDYDDATGQVVARHTVDRSDDIDQVLASTSRAYDSLGRPVSYTDSGNGSAGSASTATATYDLEGRPVTVSDGKATRTITYDEITGAVASVADGDVGTFTAEEYDADGNLTRQRLPGSIIAITTFDETGAATERSFVRGDGDCATGPTSANCHLLAHNVTANAHGQWINDGGAMTARTYTYDAAGRLVTALDQPTGSDCIRRDYTLDANTNRTRKQVRGFAATSAGCAETPFSDTSHTHSYDAADRIIDAGYSYDAFGRTLTAPATSVGGDELSVAYHANDLVRSLTQSGVTHTFELDPEQRIRTKTTTGSTSGVERYAYADDSDVPAWIQGEAMVTRFVGGLADGLTATSVRTTDNGTSHHRVELALPNLHGDLAATVPIDDTRWTATERAQLAGTVETAGLQDEFGAPLAGATPQRYSWLGSHQRETALDSGVVLMGVRLYNPHTGRFLSVDPLIGGSSSSYDYANHDPVNQVDLTGESPMANPVVQRWATIVFNAVLAALRWLGPKALRAATWVKDRILAAARVIGRGIVAAWRYIRSVRITIQVHGAHHRFGRHFRKHLYIQYRDYRQGSHRGTQIPYGPKCKNKWCR